jgi:hypothetical protein
LITDHWNKGGKRYDVQFYRRPLSDILNHTLQHFSIQQLIEPKPTLTFKEKVPESYERLMKKPAFLLIKAKAK